MMHLEVGGARVPVPAGETVIGSAPGCAIVLEGEGVCRAMPSSRAPPRAPPPSGRPRPARSCSSTACGSGADPTPVLHGDKIQIGPHEILAVDDRRDRAHPALRFRRLRRPRPVRRAPSAGRRRHRRPPGLPHRRPGVHHQRRAAGVRPRRRLRTWWWRAPRSRAATPRSERDAEGYVLIDLSVNGTYVNGERVGRQHLLARADVIRIGHDEFRFYADVRVAADPAAAPQRAAGDGAAAARPARARACPTRCTACRPSGARVAAGHADASRRWRRSRRSWCGAARSRASGCRSRCRW